jgi:hypothetical protein
MMMTIVAGEMFLNLFGFRDPNKYLPDFWIYFGRRAGPRDRDNII